MQGSATAQYKGEVWQHCYLAGCWQQGKIYAGSRAQCQSAHRNPPDCTPAPAPAVEVGAEVALAMLEAEPVPAAATTRHTLAEMRVLKSAIAFRRAALSWAVKCQQQDALAGHKVTVVPTSSQPSRRSNHLWRWPGRLLWPVRPWKQRLRRQKLLQRASGPPSRRPAPSSSSNKRSK